MGYDFSTLNDKELETLVRDLLNKKFKLELQDFKAGKDKGIDLRLSTPSNNNSLVVQVKHYVNSGFQKLSYKLTNEELAKVRVLSPERYIIVTSVRLSAAEKDKLRDALSPFILSSNDVIGQEDLNAYLREFPEIEANWFKLWLSSTHVLQTIINNSIHGKSAFFSRDIKDRIGLYVQSNSYEDAYKILEENNYIVITGHPGVGKTTLAKIMTYQLLAKGFSLVYIDDDIADAERIFNDNPEDKQLFYFDDFLGANYLEITSPKTTETRFVSFVQRIEASKNKLLILTTRTTIYQSALSKYEKLSRTNIDIARKEIQLGNYSDLDKAKILYNHLFHSKLPDDYLNEVFRDKRYWQVIKHSNYTPRLIEFVTTPSNFRQISSDNYFAFIIGNLKDPSQIWLHAYEQQFSAEDRLLVQTVFSIPNSNTIQVQEAFNALLTSLVENNNHVPSLNPFVSSLKLLLDGILKKEIVRDDNSDRISFVNPSIADFLINYLIRNSEQRWQLVNSIVFVEQLERLQETIFNLLKYRDPIPEYEYSRFARHVMSKPASSWRTANPHLGALYDCELRIALLLAKIPADKQTAIIQNEAIKAVLSSIEFSLLTTKSSIHLIKIVRYSNKDSTVGDWVLENWNDVVSQYFGVAREESDLTRALDLFSEYEKSYEDYISDDDHYNLVRENLEYVADRETERTVSDGKKEVQSYRDWTQLKRQVEDFRGNLYSTFSLDDVGYDESYFFDEKEIEKLLQEEEEEEDGPRLDWKDYRELNTQGTTGYVSEEAQIDRLFERNA